MNADPLDLSKNAAVDASIDNAQSKAHVAAFGKAAYEAYRKHCRTVDLAWSDLPTEVQCGFVAVAQAVLDEAKKAGWL